MSALPCPTNYDSSYLLWRVSRTLERHVGVVPIKDMSCPRDVIVVTTKPLPIPKLVVPSFVVVISVMGVAVTMVVIGSEEDAGIGLDSNTSIWASSHFYYFL